MSIVDKLSSYQKINNVDLNLYSVYGTVVLFIECALSEFPLSLYIYMKVYLQQPIQNQGEAIPLPTQSGMPVFYAKGRSTYIRCPSLENLVVGIIYSI